MRVLFTGASSFSGLWFARALAAAGHEVVAALRSPRAEDPLRAERLRQAAAVAMLAPEAPFGGAAFLDLVAQGAFDAICHHGAEAAGHKRPDFDVAGAVAANTFGAEAVLAAAKATGVRRFVLTGTAFEEGEGLGEEPRRAFSPYGLSKTLTSRAFADMTRAAGVDFVKFVVPNPFGPFEAQTFQRYVMTAWRKGEAVHVSHPFYERDNVPVDLLARVYAAAAEGRLGEHVSPSCYAGPVGAFFRRMAAEVAPRTGWACRATYADSQTFDEPRMRLNLHRADPADYGWSEAGFWDAYAGYYAAGG